MHEYQKLIEEHKATREVKSELELSLLERRIWASALPHLKRVEGTLVSKREWLANKLGIPTHAVENRSNLLGYGGAEDNALWGKVVNDGLSIRAAVRFAREAREQSNKTGISLPEALQAKVALLDQLTKTHTPTGKVTYRQSPMQKPAEPDVVVQGSPESEAQPPGDSERTFWAILHTMLTTYVRDRLKGVDQGVVEKICREFETDLKVTFSAAQSKFDRVRRDHLHTRLAASRRDVLHACRILNIEAPPAGKPIEDAWRKKEKKVFRSLAAVYHPDSSGSEATRDTYEQVVEAHRLLEDI